MTRGMNKLCKSTWQFVNNRARAANGGICPHSATGFPQLFRAPELPQWPARKRISGLSSVLRPSIYYY
jgi:hypothetical protein